MVTICTSTFYNYVEQDKIDDFSKEDLPMKTKRKRKNEKKTAKSDPKGKSIEERPFALKTEVNLVTGKEIQLLAVKILPTVVLYLL